MLKLILASLENLFLTSKNTKNTKRPCALLGLFIAKNC